MNAAVPSATVTGYEATIPSIVLPDENDRHVVAAAVAASASVIVTWNVRDIPMAELRKHGLQTQTPDLFLTRLYDRIPDLAIETVRRAPTQSPTVERSAGDFLQALQAAEARPLHCQNRVTPVRVVVHRRL